MTTNPLVILYVEDDVCIRELFVELLETPERHIVPVANSASAHDILRAQKVNLLITDIQLPDGSGLDVAREALRQNPRLPVIVCSGNNLMDVTSLLGPTAHVLRKPVGFEEFEALVEKLLQ